MKRLTRKQRAELFAARLLDPDLARDVDIMLEAIKRRAAAMPPPEPRPPGIDWDALERDLTQPPDEP